MDISAILRLLSNNNSISKDNFFASFETLQGSENLEDESIFSQEHTDEDMANLFAAFDTNADGVIDYTDFDVNGDGEINDLDTLETSPISDELISQDDLNLLVNQLNDLYSELGLEPTLDIQTPEETPAPEKIQMTEETQSVSKPKRNKKSSHSSSSGDKKPEGPKAEDYSKMSVQELQAKLTTSKGDLSTKQDALNKIINGSDSKLQELQAGVDSAEEAYQTTLNTVAPELGKQYTETKQDLDTHKQDIANQEVSINEKNSEIDSLTSEVASLEGQISAYDSSIANLESWRGKENAPLDLESRISNAKSKRDDLIAQKNTKNEQLATAKTELGELETQLGKLNEQTADKEAALQNIETQIAELNNSELTTLKEAVTAAQTAYETQKESMRAEAEKTIVAAQSEIDKIQSALDAKQAKTIEKENSVLSIGDPKLLYETMGLEERGLKYETFLTAMEGYSNLEDKGNGHLVIFDPTQSEKEERCYILDMENFEVLGQCRMNTGKGNMNNVAGANVLGSGATLSGFEMVAEEYYSSSMGMNAMRLDGLEDGINDNSRRKGTVVHFSMGHTLGCKGFQPIMKNGYVDRDATYAYMREMFSTGTVFYTQPTDLDEYEELSVLV